ncbi:hypothetical protein C5167_028065 [Papaver somniferum]|uniref:MLP-like protein 423 n=1 Tax=Papaver somniferum TaxID=3469 RepID=UPI000E6FFB81|nr:MLP-like protein 423 [Papaver somniferum]RZC92811.1 hypothetical protein C5167_028065 [Papaver somniferum]
MSQIHKLEVEYKAKCPAEKLYTMLTRDAPKLPNYASQTINKCQVLPGDGEVRLGSIFVWDYVQGDKPSAVITKVKITAVDHKNMSLTYTVFEGHLTDDYPSFANILAITPTQRNGNNNFLVKWSVEYEKANEDIPDPTYFMKMLEDFTKELNTNLLKEE